MTTPNGSRGELGVRAPVLAQEYCGCWFRTKDGTIPQPSCRFHKAHAKAFAEPPFDVWAWMNQLADHAGIHIDELHLGYVDQMFDGGLGKLANYLAGFPLSWTLTRTGWKHR